MGSIEASYNGLAKDTGDGRAYWGVAPKKSRSDNSSSMLQMTSKARAELLKPMALLSFYGSSNNNNDKVIKMTAKHGNKMLCYAMAYLGNN